MKKKQLTFNLTVFESFDELSLEEKELMNQAVAARKNAYAPYSNFQVGSAILLENDEIIIGNNQENASYPSGLCAERVAIFHAGAKYPDVVVKAIAISATSIKHVVDTPAAPCGNCRQSMSEYEFKQKKNISIFMMGETGEIHKCDSIADILPLAFNNSFL